MLLIDEVERLARLTERQGLRLTFFDFVAPTTLGALGAGLGGDIAQLRWELDARADCRRVSAAALRPGARDVDA